MVESGLLDPEIVLGGGTKEGPGVALDNGTDVEGYGTDVVGHGTDVEGHGTDVEDHGADAEFHGAVNSTVPAGGRRYPWEVAVGIADAGVGLVDIPALHDIPNTASAAPVEEGCGDRGEGGGRGGVGASAVIHGSRQAIYDR